MNRLVPLVIRPWMLPLIVAALAVPIVAGFCARRAAARAWRSGRSPWPRCSIVAARAQLRRADRGSRPRRTGATGAGRRPSRRRPGAGRADRRDRRRGQRGTRSMPSRRGSWSSRRHAPRARPLGLRPRPGARGGRRVLAVSLGDAGGRRPRAGGRVGDADPVQAIGDELATFPAREVVLVAGAGARGAEVGRGRRRLDRPVRLLERRGRAARLTRRLDRLAPVVEDPLEVAAHEQAQRRAPRADRSRSGSGRGRGSPSRPRRRLELVGVVPERVGARELDVDEAVRRLPGLDPRPPANRDPVQAQRYSISGPGAHLDRRRADDPKAEPGRRDRLRLWASANSAKARSERQLDPLAALEQLLAAHPKRSDQLAVVGAPCASTPAARAPRDARRAARARRSGSAISRIAAASARTRARRPGSRSSPAPAAGEANQEPVLAVADHLVHRRRVVGDHRQPERHRLVEVQAESLPAARGDADIGRRRTAAGARRSAGPRAPPRPAGRARRRASRSSWRSTWPLTIRPSIASSKRRNAFSTSAPACAGSGSPPDRRTDARRVPSAPGRCGSRVGEQLRVDSPANARALDPELGVALALAGGQRVDHVERPLRGLDVARRDELLPDEAADGRARRSSRSAVDRLEPVVLVEQRQVELVVLPPGDQLRGRDPVVARPR